MKTKNKILIGIIILVIAVIITGVVKADFSKSEDQNEKTMHLEHSNQNKEKMQTKTKSQHNTESKAELSNDSNKSTNQSINITGYITSEDDFAAGLKEDTANMVYMKPMALSGIGITFEQNGKWIFYYFDGKIASSNKRGTDGKWFFDGTGSQLNAWNIAQKRVKEGKGRYPIQVTVKGALNGKTVTNPGPDAHGKKFPVITVEPMN